MKIFFYSYLLVQIEDLGVDIFDGIFITRPNCAQDRRTILCLYVPGFQRQVFKHVKEMKEQKKNKGSVLVVESAYKSQNAQFGLVKFYQQFLRKMAIVLSQEIQKENFRNFCCFTRFRKSFSVFL